MPGHDRTMMTDAMTARLKPVQPGRTSLVTVLDIGSTKICCLIARLVPRPLGDSSRPGRSARSSRLGKRPAKSSSASKRVSQ